MIYPKTAVVGDDDDAVTAKNNDDGNDSTVKPYTIVE